MSDLLSDLSARAIDPGRSATLHLVQLFVDAEKSGVLSESRVREFIVRLPEGCALRTHLPQALKAQESGRSPFLTAQYTIVQAQGLELTAPMPARQSGFTAPGSLLARVLGRIMTSNAYYRYVYPAIAEMQAEYFEVLARAGRDRARRVAIRGRFLILPSFVYGLITQLIRGIFIR